MSRSRANATTALRDLRAARRRRYAERLDLMEVLYRIYLAGIFGIGGLIWLAGLLADNSVSPSEVARIASHGPPLAGIGLALLVLGGLRSGARGGPLSVQDADVHHILLAPIERSAVLAAPARRQLWTAALAGAGVGALVAEFSLRRLPGANAEWIACLAIFGALAGVALPGSALLASGRRLSIAKASALGIVLVGWSLADMALGWGSSPLTMLGGLVVLPLPGGGGLVTVAVGAFVVLALCVYGFLSRGGLSLEMARRRAALVAELRFSASVQDLRTVILLRRQLAGERPRSRPWLRLPSFLLRGYPVWRRGTQAYLRWPASRGARMGAVGLAAGLLAAGAWAGTTPLVALVGLVLYVAGLDVVEPLAQEFDHPTRRDLLPVSPSSLVVRHLISAIGPMALVAVAAVVATVALGAGGGAIGAGAVMVVPTAILIVCCAALSATNDPYAHLDAPEMALAQTFAPVVLAVLGVTVPVLVAREASRRGHSPVGVVMVSQIVVLIVCCVAVGVVAQRAKKSAPEIQA